MYFVSGHWVERYQSNENLGTSKYRCPCSTGLPRGVRPPQKYYKRVVVAVRPKGQDKLSLKMFKEVPASALEQLLPDGKIRMSKFDQGLIATSVGVGSLTLLVKAVSSLADIQLKWTLIVAGVTGLAGLRFWNSYKNRRVKYLMQLSRTLYYKNVANNRGLLALLVDRAQDESFKEALIMYTFLLSHRRPSSTEPLTAEKSGSQSQLLDEEDANAVVPLASAILSLPYQAPSIISRTEDVVDLEEGYDRVYMEQEEMYHKDEKKQKRHGWS
ncbi:putative transmembrane protein [Apostichopus japonicus]|uniref:Putative transmembrane protein n=1 Tax=Stichopus japonicus TaxID=307972 RepID=A0A2G8JWH9_STIJA|nr:putative transmembrane protein [Apostichopus japonicus]